MAVRAWRVTVAVVLEAETQAAHAAAHARLEHRAPDRGREHRGGIREHPLAQLRHGVEERGDEHVARDAADRIEMDVRVTR